MPLETRLSYRKPARLVAAQEEEKNTESPQPVSPLGGGRGSAIQAFTEGQGR